MESHTVLKLGTVLMLGLAVAAGVIGVQRTAKLDQELDRLRQAEEENLAQATGNLTGEDGILVVDQTGPRIRRGVIGETPRLSDLVKVDRVPWRVGDINRLYARSKSNACELLLPEIPIVTTLTRQENQLMAIGRIPVLTIGLELDPSARSKMPRVTLGQTEKYLAAHRLVVEPMLYQDEQNRVYFGTDCRAAFYALDRPYLTVEAEPMIGDSVRQFRALGLLNEQGQCDGRTMIMAFRYVQSDGSLTGVAGARWMTEFLVLHLLPDATPNKPHFEVYATTDNRTKLHRITSGNDLLTSPVTTITASIRFDKFVMMGLYPAKPVVTKFRLLSEAELPTSVVQLRMSNTESGRQTTFQSVLDRFDELVAEAGEVAVAK